MKIISIINEEIIFYKFNRLNEDVLKYMKKPTSFEDKSNMEYIFEASGIRYTVTIWHDDTKHDMGTYEVDFSVDEQKNSGHRTGKDLKHLNSVLQTVTAIVEQEVKEKGIKKIKIEGATGEQDIESGESGFLGTTLRAKLYLRYISNRYPSSAILNAGRYINIDMTQVFPELFKGKTNADKIVDLLVKLSDANKDEEGIRRGLYGKDADNDFGIDTDYIESTKLGGIYVVITVSEPMNQYDIEWEIFDTDDTGDENFREFQELYNWLKEFVSKATEKIGSEVLES